MRETDLSENVGNLPENVGDGNIRFDASDDDFLPEPGSYWGSLEGLQGCVEKVCRPCTTFANLIRYVHKNDYIGKASKAIKLLYAFNFLAIIMAVTVNTFGDSRDAPNRVFWVGIILGEIHNLLASGQQAVEKTGLAICCPKKSPEIWNRSGRLIPLSSHRSPASIRFQDAAKGLSNFLRIFASSFALAGELTAITGNWSQAKTAYDATAWEFLGAFVFFNLANAVTAAATCIDPKISFIEKTDSVINLSSNLIMMVGVLSLTQEIASLAVVPKILIVFLALGASINFGMVFKTEICPPKFLYDAKGCSIFCCSRSSKQQDSDSEIHEQRGTKQLLSPEPVDTGVVPEDDDGSRIEMAEEADSDGSSKGLM